MVKVFLVEDEAIIRHGIRDNIDWASHGFEFAGEAGDGEYAYPLILKAQPDILVTDIKMPFMDGLELSRLVKKTLPRTRIIVLCSAPDEGDLSAVRASGIRTGHGPHPARPQPHVYLYLRHLPVRLLRPGGPEGPEAVPPVSELPAVVLGMDGFSHRSGGAAGGSGQHQRQRTQCSAGAQKSPVS